MTAHTMREQQPASTQRLPARQDVQPRMQDAGKQKKILTRRRMKLSLTARANVHEALSIMRALMIQEVGSVKKKKKDALRDATGREQAALKQHPHPQEAHQEQQRVALTNAKEVCITVQEVMIQALVNASMQGE